MLLKKVSLRILIILNTGEVPNLFDKKEDFEDIKAKINEAI